MELHFETCGHGSPVLILHGLFGSHENWGSISRWLAERFQVFALDLRNHGQSPHSREMNYSVMAGDVREFLRSQELDRASILGHSMGGKTAMCFALTYPELVDKLICVDIAPRAYPPQHTQILETMRSLDLASFHSRAQIDSAMATTLPEKAVRQFLLKNVTRDAAGRFSWKLNLTAIDGNYSRLNEALPGTQTCSRPALFIRGEKSDYIRDSDWPLIQQLFPRSELVTIPGAAHWVHAEAPQLFLNTILTFLKS